MTRGAVDPSEEELLREWGLLHQEVDPIVREVLSTVDPWDAYRVANGICSVLVDDLIWLPHGGAVYAAWAELTDVYEIGDATTAAAHSALREAASRWLDRPDTPSADFLADWIQQARDGIEQALQTKAP